MLLPCIHRKAMESSRPSARDADMDTFWQTLFPQISIVGRRKIVYANVASPMYGTMSETISRRGFKVVGDEILRGKAFHKYARKRMSAVRFLKPGVPYLHFKHASLKSKQTMCLSRFELSDASSYFFRLLVRHFGSNFENLQTPRPGIRYLGKPGRQGVALLIKDESSGLDYVFKLAHSVGHAGFGKGVLTRGQMRKNRKTYGQYVNDGGPLGFISQAKMQMISAMHNCTVPVYACGVANDAKMSEERRVPVSFLVMPPLKMLAHKYMKDKLRVYSPELVQKHVAAKYYNLMLKMDSLVGVIHNDFNPLNVMMDEEDDMVLIDFDRASFVNHSYLQKYGLYVNLDIGLYMGFPMFGGKIRPFNRFRLRKAGQLLFKKNMREIDDDITQLNTPQTPAEVPPLPYKALAGEWAAMLPDSVKRPVFGIKSDAYLNLRF